MHHRVSTLDDILIAGKKTQIKYIIRRIGPEYELKDEVTYYSGIKTGKTDKGFALNPKIKIEKIAKQFHLENLKPCDTPMEPGYHHLKD